MQCLRPIRAGFDRFGDITYSNKNIDQSIETFAFPCRKCLPCRLNTAREKAVRATHEAESHKESIFLTLTYNNENLPKDGKLNYLDFQLFMKRLRKYVEKDFKDKETKEKLKISYIVTGEYGDKTKRPHWHALIFNYRPSDSKYKYTSLSGNKVFSSETLQELWGNGNIDFGNITIDSANYVCRYGAKKLIHGKDHEHQYHPIHKTSSKHAIGKKYLEKHYKNIFELGYIMLKDGTKVGIPRYYQDWFKKNHIDLYLKYYTTKKEEIRQLAIAKQTKEQQEYQKEVTNQELRPLTKKEIKLFLLKGKFKQLQEKLKL